MKIVWLVLTLLITLTLNSCSQSSTDSLYRVVFYNVENLFDPQDDSLKNDDSFTPTGFNHWTYKKMRKKVQNLAKVFIAIGGKKPPDIIGLAEIENLFVLRQLCYHSPLKKYNYKIIHYDSPDPRGIDVALLYRPDRVKLLHSEPIPIIFPFENKTKNRDILYAIFTFPNSDSLHIFVNHWTSRYGGYAATIIKRNYYASVVKNKVDSLLELNKNANIIITGDFNDYPTDESMYEVLQARDYSSETGVLYNLMFQFLKMHNEGSYKREDFWGCLDQIVVSSALLDENNRLFVINQQANICKESFLLVPDEKYGGKKVLRTYLGPKYIGGYSDHLPVYLNLRALGIGRDTPFPK